MPYSMGKSSSKGHIRWSTACAALGVVVLLSLAGCPGEGPVGGLEVERDIPYGVGYTRSDSDSGWSLSELLLDVYKTDDTSSSKPAVVMVHGGSFTEGSKEKEEIVAFARYLARRGYVVFAINYRLTTDNPAAPSYWSAFNLTSTVHAAIVDTKAAVRFVRANAGRFGVDPDRIGLVGESAGAIAGVAVAVGDEDRFNRDRSDLPVPDQNLPAVSDDVQAYVHLWGGADHVLLDLDRSDPPIMIVHGEDDDTFFASAGASERLHAGLELLNLPHEYYEAEDTGHGAWDYRLRLQSLESLTLAFLDTYL